jgi:hypothetical protein
MEAEAIGIGMARTSLEKGHKIYGRALAAAYTAMPIAVVWKGLELPGIAGQEQIINGSLEGC